jgi:transposase
LRSDGDERRDIVKCTLQVLGVRARSLSPAHAALPMKTTPPITSPYAPDLEQVRAWLEKMVATLRFVELVAAVVSFIGRMCVVNAELTKRLAHLQRKRPKSETLERLERQLVLPLGPMGLAPPRSRGAERGDNDKQKSKQRNNHPGRGAPPPHIERVTVLNPVPPDLRRCPLCGAEMTTVGHSRCTTLNLIPARVIAEERLDERVACPNDDTIVSAPVPRAIVDRGKLGDTFIVEALGDKYLEHVPIERQCSRWLCYGIDIDPQTLGRSVGAAIDLLSPVARAIREQTRGPGLLATDATGIPVLDPKTTEGIRLGTIWCWTNARWVTFEYSAKGDSESVRRFLGEQLARTIQCDGTNIMTFIERAGGKRPGCWSHGRRRLAEAARAGDQIALEGLRIIARLFVVERAATLAGDSAEERRARRDEHTRPILDELRAWLDEHRAIVPPKTPLGQGLGYLHRQWHRLLLFLEDGNIEATNNRRERELRRLILGRKNWLFTWLDQGGKRTADILTIIATAIAHDINPRAYLHFLTKAIVSGWPQAKLRDLLPDRILVSHPELYVGDPDLLPSSDVLALEA